MMKLWFEDLITMLRVEMKYNETTDKYQMERFGTEICVELNYTERFMQSTAGIQAHQAAFKQLGIKIENAWLNLFPKSASYPDLDEIYDASMQLASFGWASCCMVCTPETLLFVEKQMAYRLDNKRIIPKLAENPNYAFTCNGIDFYASRYAQSSCIFHRSAFIGKIIQPELYHLKPDAEQEMMRITPMLIRAEYNFELAHSNLAIPFR